MSSRPRIGITSRKIPYFHKERPYPRYGVAVNYIHAVEIAGGLPLMIPLSRDPSLLEDYFGTLDGLLLPGGMDVDPVHYGEEPHRLLEEVDPVRDETELYLAKRALKEDMPVLGVCRGEQLLNVAAGGSLFQDIAAQSPQEVIRHFQDFAQEWPSHSVELKPDTLLCEHHPGAEDARELLPPPGGAPRRAGLPRVGDGAGRRDRGDRVDAAHVRARRPVAPRAARRRPRLQPRAVPPPRRGGVAVPRVARSGLPA